MSGLKLGQLGVRVTTPNRLNPCALRKHKCPNYTRVMAGRVPYLPEEMPWELRLRRFTKVLFKKSIKAPWCSKLRVLALGFMARVLGLESFAMFTLV